MNRKYFETDGYRDAIAIVCPDPDYTCPYIDNNNLCHIKNPMKDCEVFGCYWASWEEWEEDNVGC